ncbi:MAG: hypothetical protein JXA30_01625 [Deltaproteobacteria bacterium]|nr:hypothetical protein [Deltaproteobacteria bacterium]
MSSYFRLAFFVSLLVTAVSGVLRAQQQPPTYSGEGEISELVDAKVGAVFDLTSGFRMIFPKGIDSSGVFTLRTTRERPDPSQIQQGFTRHGSTLFFDGMLSAADEPIIVGMSLQREPRRDGLKFVLAIEEETECTGANAKYKLESGLCSQWMVVATEYDERNKCMAAKVKSTGGYRLQFGWIPE